MRKRVWFVAANDAIAAVGAIVRTIDGAIVGAIVVSVGAIVGASVGATLCLASPPDAAIIIITVTATELNSSIYKQNVLIYTDRTY